MALVGAHTSQILPDSEGPMIGKRVHDLWWDAYAIRVGQSRRFVASTGCSTVADRSGWSFVFYTLPNYGVGTRGAERAGMVASDRRRDLGATQWP